jgi:2-polyprenyl-6-methoxyphenol hydroxylase-like FAD-dependent oxidoreductase
MRRPPRAIVVGGSLGGLFAANFLRQIGWEVEVFERVGDDLATRGAGIGTHDELFAAMRALGIAIDDTIGVEVYERLCLGRDGAVLHRRALVQTMSAWARVYRPLKDRFPAERYRFGMTVERVEQDASGVTACFADGTRVQGDLLIAADGIRSTVRGQLLPEAQPEYAGYVAWRGVVDEGALSAAFRENYFERYLFGLPKGEMMLCYPVPGRDDDVRPGRRCYNYVWYRHTDRDTTLKDLCTDATGRNHGMAIPPPLIRTDVTAWIRGVARDTLAPPIAEVVERSQPFFQAVFDLEAPRLALGRVVLLGDAAFVARPHVGAGVTKAAIDAQFLAQSIAGHPGDLDAALARYALVRHEFGRRIVARARRLGAYIEAVGKPDRAWSAAELDQSPAHVLREIGAKLAQIPELQVTP